MRPAKAVPPTNAQRIADALVHFEFGLRTHSARLPVEWDFVAYQMARALTGQPGDLDGVEVTELGAATRYVLRREGAAS
jgi:hypothetical protein